MSDDDRFTHELAHDEESNVRLKSTCKRCGASRIVNIREGSLDKWQCDHACPDLPPKNEATNKAYVANPNSNTVTVIDGALTSPRLSTSATLRYPRVVML
jgi:YVTN family beta-propeller protein